MSSHKIVYTNLQEMLKANPISSANKENQQKRGLNMDNQSHQRRVKTNPTSQQSIRTPHHQSKTIMGPNSMIHRDTDLQRSQFSRSCSRHSLKSTPKLMVKPKFITESRERTTGDSCEDNDISSEIFRNQCQKPMHFNEYFNEVDAVFTELEDFLYQNKEKVMSKIKFQLNQNKSRNSNTEKVTTHERIRGYIGEVSRLSHTMKKLVNETVRQGLAPQQHQKAVRKQIDVAESQKFLTETNENQRNQGYDNPKLNLINVLAMSNAKARSTRRGDKLAACKKQSIYEMVLEENRKRYLFNHH